MQPKELLRKGGGKNSAHANPDARNTARENWEKAKDDLERFKQTQRGTSDFKKKLRKFEKQVKHWWGKANFSGETHSRNAKGN